MITSLAALLEALRNAEAEILKRHDIKHGPTIGDMYEGLTREILERAIPPELGLQVVEGFIEGLHGEKSNQADVLLVRGEGRQIPYTKKFIWPISDVLAVFEVKKTLYGDSMKDGFAKMAKVSELQKAHFAAGGYVGKNISFGHKNFAKLTGYYPKLKDIDSLDAPLPQIQMAMVTEQLAPVRIILGYEGFVDEAGLRRGVEEILVGNGVGANRGFLSFPSLVICRTHAVIKINGMPYYQPMDDPEGWWCTLASNSENPTRLLLEMIWTKISAELDLAMPMDDSLDRELFSPFLRQKFVGGEVNGVTQAGFMAEIFDHKVDKDTPPTLQTWSPQDADIAETVTLMQAVRLGEVKVDDAKFQEFCVDNGTTASAIVETMVHKRVLGWANNEKTVARPIENTYGTVFTPDGKTVVSDQVAMLGLWTQDQLDKKHKGKE